MRITSNQTRVTARGRRRETTWGRGPGVTRGRRRRTTWGR